METAKWIVAFVSLICFGGLFADFLIDKPARQHLKNPAWPPHAKFHNAQGVLMGCFQGGLSLFILFYFDPLTKPWLLIAAALASLYWLAAIIAPIFPGTAWTDPEFADAWPHPLGLDPQHFLSYIMLLLLGAAIAMASV